MVDRLADFYSPDETRVWLYSKHRLLNGERVIDLIHDGRAAEVPRRDREPRRGNLYLIMAGRGRIHDRTLLDALEALDPEPFHGVVWELPGRGESRFAVPARMDAGAETASLKFSIQVWSMTVRLLKSAIGSHWNPSGRVASSTKSMRLRLKLNGFCASLIWLASVPSASMWPAIALLSMGPPRPFQRPRTSWNSTG